MSMSGEIKILYEDEDILVVSKPAGLAVHSDGRTKDLSAQGVETLADWVLVHYPKMKDVGEPKMQNEELGIKNQELNRKSEILRPGIVHRIDRDTSGALLLAKNQKAFEYLKSQFKNRSVRKEYHAFVYGKIDENFGTINKPIGRSRSDFRKWSAETSARGELRDALTYFEVIKRGESATFVRVLPKTGRTHQIRVHFKAIHHPIVADILYAPKKEKILGFNRVALHAYSLEFKNLAGRTMVVTAPYPEDFRQAVEEFDKKN
jgi:23S rRNA pseudouridine1911/1915/1917 synthase